MRGAPRSLSRCAWVALVCACAGCASTNGASDDAGPNDAGVRKEMWFAIDSLRFGGTSRWTGKPDPNAWRDYGFDLDERNTTADDSKTSLNSCHRVAGAPSLILADGHGGSDNNFGAHVMQTIRAVNAGAEDAVNRSVGDGSFTLLLHLRDVPQGFGDADDVPGELFIGTSFGGATRTTPTFTTADHWPIAAASTRDGRTIASGSKVATLHGFVRSGYWASGDPPAQSDSWAGPVPPCCLGAGTMLLPLSLGGPVVVLPIESGTIGVRLVDGSNGTIAGATSVQNLTDDFPAVAKGFGLCAGAAGYEDVLRTIRESPDLVSGAPRMQDTAVECNALSIAVGFTMKETGAPSVVVPFGSSADECAGDAGSGGDAAAGG